ncbi:MAG: polysaccharide deacetylase [Oscillospiraceae bacterium]|nr:polysaccharide deacetylase [Oscillospiraceae bacterium]
MKTIRSDKYRRRRRRSDRTKRLMVLAIIGGAVLLAAAAVAIVLLLLLPNRSAQVDPNTEPPSVTSEASLSSTDEQTAQMAKINPNAATAKTTGKLSYQSLYPELYVPIVEKIPAKEGAKVVYLTFDDGPSQLTEDLLQELKQENVKATFFLTCQGDVTSETKRLIKAIADEGHAIGIHTFSHNYQKIYASVESFLEDFSKMNDVIYEATGEKATIFRFAGGSYNSYNQKTYKDIIAEMERRGYTYFDWNVDSGDSASDATGKSIYTTTVDGITSNNKSIVLMHNSGTKKDTVKQVGAIIRAAKKKGYSFDLLDPTVKPFSFAFPEN